LTPGVARAKITLPISDEHSEKSAAAFTRLRGRKPRGGRR
jgi:hypothetical protein